MESDMNTKLSWILKVAGVAAATMTAVAGVGAQAIAIDVSRTGSAWGFHGDAVVDCQNSPFRTLTTTPQLGTSSGWEQGQNVAWRYNVYSVSAGRWVVQEAAWHTARVAALYFTTDYWGHEVAHYDGYAKLPSTTWVLGAGKFLVYVDYAWQTGTSWSYARSVTTSYRNNYSQYGIWWAYNATTCDVDMVRNR
jgi:hypothetical protein